MIRNQRGRKCVRHLLAMACTAVPALSSDAQVRAFPGAEGFGAYATGARTSLSSASVYHVTNLNDSGAGSFRDAVSQPNRFVVFDVSGVAQLLTAVSVQDNVTIAGQTAPGGGFTLYGAKVSYTGANNSITRYLRVRKGHTTGRDDALSIADGTNMIFDHLSVTWGNDETFSMNPSTGAMIDKITIQNTIIGQGIDNVNHSAGGLMTINDGRFSILRSLFIDNETRNPKVRGNNQFVNNVIYNWVMAGYIMGDTTAESNANVIGNYLIEGPSDGSSPFASGTPTFHIYADNNYYDSNKNGVLDGSLVTSYPGADVIAAPHAFPTVNVETPVNALQRIIQQVGPSLYRDEVDTRMIQEVQSNGTLGQIVLTEESLYPSWPAPLSSPPKPTDTDNDGIPDTWESSHGLNPNLNTDWKNIGLTGYTRLEEYVNELATPHANKIWTASSGNWSTAGNWSGGLPTWDDNAYVRGAGVGTNGNVTITGLGAQAFRVFVGGNGSVTGEMLTVTSGGELKVMDYTHVGYENNATLTISSGASVETTALLMGTTGFNGNLVINNGTLTTGVISHAGGSGTVQLDGATIRANGWLNFTANANIGALGLVIDGNGSVGTISGNLSGAGGLTARGSGTISLTGTNTYSGATVLEGGSTGITTDANIGGASVPITFSGGMLRINGTTITNINSHPVNWSTFNGGFDIASSSNTFTVANNIGGSGAVTKGGAGMLVLSGANSFTGGITLYGGTLSVASDANLGANGSPLTFSGGALRVTGSSLLNLDNHPLAGGTVGGTLDIQSTQPFAINQVINGSGSLTKAGSGTLVLGKANAMSGDLFIKGGAVKLGDAWGIRYLTLNLDTAGTTFDVNGFNALIGGLSGNQNFDVKGKAHQVGKNNLDTTFSGTISDSVGGGTFIKMGTGTLTLTGNSSTTSAFSITGGRINIPTLGNYGVAGPLGAGSNSSSLILDGGMLRHYGAAASTDRLFTLGVAGGTLNGAGTGAWTWSATGSISFTGTGDRTLYLEGSQAGNIFSFLLVDPPSGKLTLYKTGNSRWLLGGTQTHQYSGDTYINTGTLLQWGGANLLPYGAGKGNLFINTGAQYDMNGNDLRINALTGGGNMNHRGSTTRTLTLGYGDATGTFSGTITNTALSGQGTLNLVKTGAGEQVLTGANTYLGITTISGGILSPATLANGGVASGIGSSANLATNLVLDGGTLRSNGTSDRLFTLGANSGTLEASSGMILNSSGSVLMPGTGNRTLTLSGAGTTSVFNPDLPDPSGAKTSLTKNGTGKWTLGGIAKTFSGDIRINAGTLQTAASVLPSGAGKGNVIANGALNLGDQNASINALSGSGTLEQGGTSVRSLTLGASNIGGSFTGKIIGSSGFSLVKTGTGQQLLLGSVTLGGNLTVNSGTLLIGKLPAATINVAGGLLQQLAGSTYNDPALVSIVNAMNLTGGTFDLANNGMVINYSVSSPIDFIRTSLASGSLMSSTNTGSLAIGYGEASVLGTNPFAGITTDTTALILKTTLRGDANLDLTVNSTDFNAMLSGYGTSGAVWTNGDFTHDGKVNTQDFNLLSGNFGSNLPVSAPTLGAMVPEPATLGAVAILGLLSRRRHSR
jgi:autotransporter-associated beta strand protein